jgi:hypothetical protein
MPDNNQQQQQDQNQQQQQQQTWYSNFQNKEVAEWLKSNDKAYPDAETVAAKAWNLEKLLGADKAGRALVPPKEGAKPEEWTAFFRKLGAPEKEDGYVVPETLKDDPIAQKFRAKAHAMGLPLQHFNGLMEFVAAENKAAEDAAIATLEQKAEKEFLELRSAWGADYDKNTELGRRAARSFLPHANQEELQDILTAMEGAIGTRRTLELWANIGKSMSEHNFVPSGGTGGGTGSMTVEAARLKIKELKADAEWSKRFMNGDIEAKAEWNRLNAIAGAGG